MIAASYRCFRWSFIFTGGLIPASVGHLAPVSCIRQIRFISSKSADKTFRPFISLSFAFTAPVLAPDADCAYFRFSWVALIILSQETFFTEYNERLIK